jgi:hypothetical protein
MKQPLTSIRPRRLLAVAAVTTAAVMSATAASTAAAAVAPMERGSVALSRSTADALVDKALTAVGQDVNSSPTSALPVRKKGHSASVQTAAGPIGVTPTTVADSVVKTRSDGFQVLTVLRSGEREATFKVDLPAGATLEPAGAGYAIVVRAPRVRMQLGTLDAPWAVGADGRRIGTTYSLAGNTLTQHLQGTKINYPVVADPRLTFGRGVYLNLWGSEVLGVGYAFYVFGGAASDLACSGYLDDLIPEYGAVVKVLCVTVGAGSVISIVNSINDLANSGVDENACYQWKILPSPSTYPHQVRTRNCSG